MPDNKTSTHQRYFPANVNKAHQQSLSAQDRIALVITSAIGTMYAVYFFAIFLAGWMIWQSRIANKPFDPYPFAFLLFIGNIIQLVLMPLIMVGQNIQYRHSEIRADEEYMATTSSFHDIEHVLQLLNSQGAELQRQSKLLEELAAKK